MHDLAYTSNDTTPDPSVFEFASRRSGRRVGSAATQARIGAGEPAKQTPQADATNVFRREGDYWTVAYDGLTMHVQHRKGLAYLAQLLAHPGRDVHSLDLVSAVHEPTGCAAAFAHRPLEPGEAVAHDLEPRDVGDAGPLLDASAREAYRRRLSELRESVEEAWRANDLTRVGMAEEEIHSLTRELARGVGLAGRDRRAGSVSERARLSVTRAIRTALARIDLYHPTLALHLRKTVRTGTFCSYDPDPRVPIVWVTVA